VEVTILAGEFQLDGPPHHSAMSEVWPATSLATGERVAVKLLAAELADDRAAVERFEQEVAIGWLLHDVPEVVSLVKSGRTAGGRPFFVMEWMEQSLADRLRQVTVLDVDETVAWVSAGLRALVAAHSRGVLHRDLKPGNLMRSDRIALSDFGVAALGAPGCLTLPGAQPGTPRYYAPERHAGQPATERSDLCSLGMVAYEALTGRLPWAGTEAAVREQQRTLRCPPVSAYNPAVPDAVSDVIARAIAIDPADRYASAAEMLGALERAASGAAARPAPAFTPVLSLAPAAAEPLAPAAGPPVPAPRPKQTSRLSRALAAASAAGAAVLLLATTLSDHLAPSAPVVPGIVFPVSPFRFGASDAGPETATRARGDGAAEHHHGPTHAAGAAMASTARAGSASGDAVGPGTTAKKDEGPCGCGWTPGGSTGSHGGGTNLSPAPREAGEEEGAEDGEPEAGEGGEGEGAGEGAGEGEGTGEGGEGEAAADASSQAEASAQAGACVVVNGRRYGVC